MAPSVDVTSAPNLSETNPLQKKELIVPILAVEVTPAPDATAQSTLAPISYPAHKLPGEPFQLEDHPVDVIKNLRVSHKKLPSLK